MTLYFPNQSLHGMKRSSPYLLGTLPADGWVECLSCKFHQPELPWPWSHPLSRGISHPITGLCIGTKRPRKCVSHSVVSNCLRSHGLSLVGFSVHGILQAIILEWVGISFSRGSSRPKDWTRVSCIAGGLFIIWATGKPTKAQVFLWIWHFWSTISTLELPMGMTETG